MRKNFIETPIQSDYFPVVSGIHHHAEFVKFAMWYGTPSQFREPGTQKEFASSIGVCEDTVTDWKKHPQFSLFVFKTLKEWIKDRVPDVIGGLYLKATSEKVGAGDVALFLKLAETSISSDKNKKHEK